MSTETLSSKAKSPSSLINSIIFSLLLALWIISMTLIFLVVRLILPGKIESMYRMFHQVAYRLFRIKLTVSGEVHKAKPTLYLSNHISYIDIMLLGAVTPGYFIAKSEVANWPVFGVLAKLQNTLFIERKSRRIKQQLGLMAAHFDNKDKGNLILFPEGTSTDGEHVEPFKPSLLQSVEMADSQVTIQPVTVAYKKYKGKPMNRFIRDHFAWYDTMPFGSHFFTALGMGSSECEIIFHEPVSLSDFESRKACAEYCFNQVNQGLLAAINEK